MMNRLGSGIIHRRICPSLSRWFSENGFSDVEFNPASTEYVLLLVESITSRF